MKKTIALIALLALVCASALSAQAVLKGKAVVIQKTAEFWEMKDGKNMTYVETLTRGQELDLERGTSEGAYKGKKYNLQKVSLDGKQGWVIETLIAKEPILGVVSAELATLYSQPRDTAVLSTVLPVGNVVALWPVTGKPDFYMITAYEGDTWTLYKEKYILSSDVSVRSQDVSVVLLVGAAAGMPKKEQKKKILETIRTKYSDTAMTALVEKLRAEVEGDAASVNISLEGDTGVSYVDTLKALKPVNVRETPSTSAKVVKVIEAGELMEASSRSAETSTIGSDTDYWYFITSPVRGWVFGAFVEGVK